MPGPGYASHSLVIGISSTKYLLASGNLRPEDMLVSSQRSNRSEAIHGFPIPAEKFVPGHSLLGKWVCGRSRRGDYPKVCETPGKTKRDR